MDAYRLYQAWLEDPLIEEGTKQELRELAENKAEIEDRFGRWLEFGTGGIRSTIGAGSNRINIYTVRLVTQALANSLKSKGKDKKGVAIAYDSRHMSWEFGQAAASVLVGNGIPVYVFREMAPTPLLSFAVRFWRAGAGIVVTASHNPPEYNGYKAYNQHGGQLLLEDSLQISSQMAALDLNDVKFAPQAEESPLWHWLEEETIQAYFAELAKIAPTRGEAPSLRVLYTPLHGTGARFVPEALEKSGFRVSTVSEQMVPDGSFPTVAYPNPEEKASYSLALEYAEKEPYDLILATDPDADRVGVAVNHKGDWVYLNGNQIGMLLADYLLAHLSPAESEKAVVVKTIVTSEMIRAIAAKYGGEVLDTLTGFKYIAALMDELDAQGKHFVLGFEESYGYLAGMAVRDKDAVLASLLIAQTAAFYGRKGLSLVGVLENLLREHGYYLQDSASYAFASEKEGERFRGFIRRLQQQPLTLLGDEKIREVLDYDHGIALDLQTKQERKIDLPRENVLQWLTAEGSKITVRLSGTEPKMKLYLEARGTSRNEAEERLKNLKGAFDSLVRQELQG